MTCCTSPSFSTAALSSSPSSSSSNYYTSPSFIAPSEALDKEAASLAITEFTSLVSAALDYNPIFEPLTFPSHPESRHLSGSARNRRSLKPAEKVTVLKRIKSILLRESATVHPVERSSDIPRLPLPPPTDPLFTPYVPLPLAIERGLVNTAEPIPIPTVVYAYGSDSYTDSDSDLDKSAGEAVFEDHASSSSCFQPSAESGDVEVPPESAPELSASCSSSDSASSSSCSNSLLSHASSLDLTSDPSDPFAKGRVQVVRRSIDSSSFGNGSNGSVCSVGAYSLGHHPYASTKRSSSSAGDTSPSKQMKKKKITEPPMPPPSCPLPPPPVSTVSPEFSSPVSMSSAQSDLPPLPPLLPMPTIPLPPTPAGGDPLPTLSPRASARDWTLDLPHDHVRRISLSSGLTAVSRRRPSLTTTRRARRNSLQKAALNSIRRTSVIKEDSSDSLRPGHRRKGSPFPLLFESPPAPIPSPLSTPIASTFKTPNAVSTPTGSPQKPRSSRPAPLAHTLVLSPTGLPIPPRSVYELDVPTTPTSLCGMDESMALSLDGRTHVPGWFD